MDDALPASVRANLEYLNDLNVWHAPTNNPPVKGCADAAGHRTRLGTVGIPLCDELKSNVGLVHHPNGTSEVAVVHCRGHQLLDNDKLTTVLGGRFERVSADFLVERFGLQYGIVTPFFFARNSIKQIVDKTVVLPFFSPGTMMTNLGDPRHGVEFVPDELVDSLPNVLIRDVVRDSDGGVPKPVSIGILTGNSPESGILLWQMINDLIRRSELVRFRGDTSFPRVLVESLPPMGASMELPLRETYVEREATASIEKLCSLGANLIAVACNTTQYFASIMERVCQERDATYVGMSDVLVQHLVDRGVKSFDFLGIGPVTDFRKWSGFTELPTSFDVRIPSEQEILSISELAFSVKREVVSGGTVNRLRSLISRATSTNTVVLALTELSVLFASQRRQKSDKVYIDTLDLLSRRIVELYLYERQLFGAT